jgi:amidase
MSTDLHYLALADVARRLEARTLSSVDVTRALLDRIARVDRELKSFAVVTPERALTDAAERDAEAASGRRRGPLHGR